MRKIVGISSIAIAIIATNCHSGNRTDKANPASKSNNGGTSEIIFREYEHAFGKVAAGEKLSYTFIFDNKGSGDLIISSAATTCGCTVPKFDKKPIAPGGNGKLEVVFDTSGRNGTQTKTITVKSNASTPVVLLKITAEIVTTNK
jgi:hypothetical protein